MLLSLIAPFFPLWLFKISLVSLVTEDRKQWNIVLLVHRCLTIVAVSNCDHCVYMVWLIHGIRHCIIVCGCKMLLFFLSTEGTASLVYDVTFNVRNHISPRLSLRTSPSLMLLWHHHQAWRSAQPQERFLSSHVPLSFQLRRKEAHRWVSDMHSIMLLHQPTRTLFPLIHLIPCTCCMT